jgi:hypothetical protein
MELRRASSLDGLTCFHKECGNAILSYTQDLRLELRGTSHGVLRVCLPLLLVSVWVARRDA